MSLLSKAKVITTPTAYSDGILHSVKPNVFLGGELVTNGTFDTDITGWVQYVSVSSWDNGTIKSTSSGTTIAIRQNGILSDNTTYKLTFDAKASTLNQFSVYTGVDWQNIEPVLSATDTWESFEVVFTFVTGGQHLIIRQTNTVLNDTANFDNVSVKEIINADFTFTRNSSATRVGEDGYIQDVQIIGSELVQNGNFDEIGSELVTNGDFENGNTGWANSNTNGFSVSNGKLNLLDVAYTKSTLQTNVTTIGKIYKVTYEVSDYVQGNFRLVLGGTILPTITSNGVYTDYVTATAATYVVIQAFSGTPTTLSIDNVSVKEVGQNWTFGTGWTMGDGVVVGTSVSKQFMQQPFTFVSGKKYRTTCTITGTNTLTNDLCFRLPYDGTISNIEYATKGVDGVYTQEFISTGGSSIYFGYIDTGTFTGLVDNISVKEITEDTNLPRINYEGFSYQDVLGSELVFNGDFSSPTGWSLFGATISDGKANIIGDGSAFTNISQSGVFTSGKQYQVKVDVVINSGLGLKFQDGANNENIGFATTSGTYTFNFTATSNSTIVIGRRAGGAPFNSSVDNVSVKEYLGQEVVPDSGCGSWLFEPQTTQLMPYSEDFSQWSAGGDTTIESGYLAPDGTNNAYKVSGTSSALTLNEGLLTTTTTRSIYARTTSGTGQANLCSFNGNSNNLFTITEDWQRFEVNSAISTGVTTFYAVDFRGSTTLSEIIIWGANATNDQDYATSYIPSKYGSAVTRSAETCNNAGNADLFDSTEGVLYADIKPDVDYSTYSLISISDGTTANNVVLGKSINTGKYYTTVKSGNSNQFSYAFAVEDVFNKIAVRYKENDFSVWLNGVQVHTDISGAAPTGLSKLTFDFGDGGLRFYGKTKMVAVFPYLSNDEMECLTGEGYGSFEAMALANNYTII